MTEQELEGIIHRTYRPLYRQVVSQLGETDAEDLLQEVYWRAWRRLVLDDRGPIHWLRRATQSLINTRLKARYGTIPISLDQLIETGWELEAQATCPDAVAWLTEQSRALPPMRRAVLWLREVLGWDDALIASRLGITATTVRRHASLGRQQLRALSGRNACSIPAPTILTIHASSIDCNSHHSCN